MHQIFQVPPEMKGLGACDPQNILPYGRSRGQGCGDWRGSGGGGGGGGLVSLKYKVFKEIFEAKFQRGGGDKTTFHRRRTF